MAMSANKLQVTAKQSLTSKLFNSTKSEHLRWNTVRSTPYVALHATYPESGRWNTNFSKSPGSNSVFSVG